MAVWERGANFLDMLLADKDVTSSLTPDHITSLFDLSYHTKNVNTIFKRVFGRS
jgi:adenylosuccinate lyase